MYCNINFRFRCKVRSATEGSGAVIEVAALNPRLSGGLQWFWSARRGGCHAGLLRLRPKGAAAAIAAFRGMRSQRRLHLLFRRGATPSQRARVPGNRGRSSVAQPLSAVLSSVAPIVRPQCRPDRNSPRRRSLRKIVVDNITTGGDSRPPSSRTAAARWSQLDCNRQGNRKHAILAIVPA